MKIHLSASQWGGAYKTSEGKLKVYRKPADASQKRRQKTSKRVRVISQKTALKMSRP